MLQCRLRSLHRLQGDTGLLGNAVDRQHGLAIGGGEHNIDALVTQLPFGFNQKLQLGTYLSVQWQRYARDIQIDITTALLVKP